GQEVVAPPGRRHRLAGVGDALDARRGEGDDLDVDAVLVHILDPPVDVLGVEAAGEVVGVLRLDRREERLVEVLELVGGDRLFDGDLPGRHGTPFARIGGYRPDWTGGSRGAP